MNDGTSQSKEAHWFVETLRTEFSVEVAPEEIGIEATELGMGEVDDAFIPNELFTIVPSSLLYEIMVVDDDLYNVWVGAVAFYPNSSNWCLQVMTKNDEVVFRKVSSIID